MSDDTKDATGKRRIQVEDLPQEERELSVDEQKSVQGGAKDAVTPGIRTGGTNAVGDGSVMDSPFTGGVRTDASISDGTSNTMLSPEQNKK